jgi:uncharacterized protein (DUF1778 family)
MQRRRTAARAKTERLELRVSSDQKRLFQRAAETQGLKLSEFVTSTLATAAKQAIHDAEVMVLGAEDREVFVRALMNPPAPSRNLLRAGRRYQKWLASGQP